MKQPKTYQPKGSMCVVCNKATHDCSKLGFNRMPVIERSGSVMVVRCREFEK